MILIVGLGNPGKNYSDTRHNVGFMALDQVASKYSLTWETKAKFKAEVALGSINDYSIVLCKPQTYMNLSGQSVQLLAQFYKIKPTNIIVIHDDIDLHFAKIKCKLAGGNAGHNGLKSIDSIIGREYYRVRFGVGRPKEEDHHLDIGTFVLQNFSHEETKILQELLPDVAKKIPLLFNIITKGDTQLINNLFS
jgi:PTH1 family peptidyl-tRNA hydrolase